MAEIAVNLKGQDNLTQTVKNATKSVDELKYHSTELGKASKEFDKITNSGKSLKAQLNQLKALMADMNMKGLSGSEEFTKIAEKAGEIKDAMSDASDAINRFSSDTMKLDAAIQMVQGVAAAASIATGAMALFGTENEKVQQAILKVQAALAILNGVQAIANTLNKDSALMQRIKQIRLAASTRTTVADTVATTANTVATTANTVATGANTVAQKSWNVAKAIGKALFGDFTGLLLVGVSALAAYAIATDDATEKQEDLNQKTDEGAEKQKHYKDVMTDTYSSLMMQYTKLKVEWNNLKTTHEKNQFLVENKNKMLDLGGSVNNVVEAEKFFNGNTNAVVQSFIARAKAAARLAELTDLYRKQMELLDQRNDQLIKIQASSPRNRTGVTAVAGAEIPQGAGNFDSRYGKVDSSGKWVFTVEGADNWNKSLGENSSSIQALDRQIDANNRHIENVVKAIQQEAKSNNRTNTRTSTPRTTPRTTTHTTPTKQGNNPIAGSLEAMEKELSELQDKLKKNVLPQADVDKINQRIEQLKKDIEAKKIELGIELRPSKESLSNLEEELDNVKKALSWGLFKDDEIETAKQRVKQLEQDIEAKKIQLGFELSPEAKQALEDLEQIKKANEELANIKPYSNQTSSFDKAVSDTDKSNGYTATNQDRLDAIQKEMDYNDDLIAQLQELLMLYTQLGNVEGIQKVTDQLGQLVTRQDQLKNDTKELRQEQIDWERQQQAMNGVADVANSLGSAMSSLGNMFSAVGDESVAAIMEMVATTMQGVATIIPQILSLIAAKQGEAMASGTASAASLPFPANIAAIAAVTATILSTFASIIAATQKFANGGIVGGGSPYGDHLLARVNSGEMILNGKQQKRLFDLLDNGGAIGGASMGDVKFVLKGSDLYGSFHNFTKIKSKVGKQIL